MLSVAGNFDLKVLEAARAPKMIRGHSIKRMVATVAAGDMSSESLDFIASLPSEIRMNIAGSRVLMVHSSPATPNEHISSETPDSRLEEIARMANADIVMVGHSHKPLLRSVCGTLFINPGSVGRPSDNDPRASYAILDLDDLSMQLRRAEYDFESAAQAILDRGLPFRDRRYGPARAIQARAAE